MLVHGETSRLKPLTPACVVFDGVVTGTSTTREGDGDLHILLYPEDKDDRDLMNSDNEGKNDGRNHVLGKTRQKLY